MIGQAADGQSRGDGEKCVQDPQPNPGAPCGRPARRLPEFGNDPKGAGQGRGCERVDQRREFGLRKAVEKEMRNYQVVIAAWRALPRVHSMEADPTRGSRTPFRQVQHALAEIDVIDRRVGIMLQKSSQETAIAFS